MKRTGRKQKVLFLCFSFQRELESVGAVASFFPFFLQPLKKNSLPPPGFPITRDQLNLAY